MKRALIVLFAAALSGCGYAGYLKDPFADIPAFATVNEGIARGACPRTSGYAKLQAIGVRTILDLNDNAKRVAQHRQAAETRGFNFVNAPLSIYSWPEDEKTLLILRTLLDKDAQPVFICCSNGRDRTGAMIAMYRVIVEGWGPKEAYDEALSHGFWPYRGEVVLKKYIHQLKDRKLLYDYARQERAGTPEEPQ